MRLRPLLARLNALRRPIAWWFGLTCCAAGVAQTARAQGEPSSAEAPARRSLVLLVPDVPDDDFDERLLDAILIHGDFSGGELHVVRFDPGAFPQDLVGVSKRRAGEFLASGAMWIDLRNPAEYAIYLYEIDSHRLLGRKVPVSPEAPAAAREVLANIAGSVVAESLTGAVAGLDEVDPAALAVNKSTSDQPTDAGRASQPQARESGRRQRATHTRSAKAKAESRRRLHARPTARGQRANQPDRPWPKLWFGTEYVGSTFAAVVPWQHGAGLSAGWNPAPGAFVGLRYDLVLPTRMARSGVAFELRRHPVSVEGGYRFRFGRRRRGDVELGARVVLDPIVRRSDEDASSRAVTGAATRLFVSAIPGVGLGLWPHEQIRLGIRLGAELLLTRAPYVVADAGGGEVVVDPQPVRFTLDAGLRFGFVWGNRGRKAPAPLRPPDDPRERGGAPDTETH